MAPPSKMKSWVLKDSKGFDSLKFEDVEVPKPSDRDVLVRFHGASLNYRDLIIAKGTYPFNLETPVVPASDGAGIVEAVGSSVTLFKPGDKVVTLFHQGHQGGSVNAAILATGLGGVPDGTLREYGTFAETGLVKMPSNLDYIEASTLTCAGLTAWNALYGIESSALKAGDWVLTQGTGGVSMFALQFAVAAGARVIATSSSSEKCERLKKLGAVHTINYKDNPNWGEEAKKITGGTGVHHIVEVAGPSSMKQSLNAIAIDGIISIIGFVGGTDPPEQPSFLDCLTNICIARGVMVGSRVQFEAMNRAIEANNIHPVLDEKIFSLDKANEAYQYMWDQGHYGKIGIKI